MDSVRMFAILTASILTMVLAVGFGSGNSTMENFSDNVRNVADSTIIGINSVTVLPVKLEGVLEQSTVSTEKSHALEHKALRKNLTQTETGTSLEMRRFGTRLEMGRLGQERGRRVAASETTGRQVFIGETFPMAEQQIGNNQDKDSQGSENVQDIRNYYGRFEADDRYYNELGYLPSDDEQTLRVSEVNFPEERAKSGLQNAESTSCRKYLEFLKYAFEQLDSEGRALEHSQNQGRPNWYLLPRTGHGGDENSTPLQSASRSNDEHVNDTSAQVSAGTENLTVVKKEGIPAYPVETPAAAKTPDEDALLGEYNKIFPCPDKFNVTYPVNGYCNRFVVCELGKPRPEFCQDGLHFNLVTRRCDLPHDSFCTYSCPRANGYFGVPGDCGGFFRCLNWYPEYRMCPPKMHWDIGAKICVFQEFSSCPLKCDKPNQVKSYGDVCSSYVICSGGEPAFHTCPNEANFEPKLLKCVPQAQYNCTSGEDYIVRNTGLENTTKTLCAKVELTESTSKWCQEKKENK